MKSATYFASAASLDGLPVNDRPQVAMIGRSNVGKSSLINHLVGMKDLAHSSSKPGRTQTINLYEIDKKFFLADLPGYGFAKKSAEQKAVFAGMIEDYLLNCETLALVLLIIDTRIPPSELDASMLEWLQFNQLPFVIVMNKVDKVKKNDLSKMHADLERNYPGIPRIEHSIDSDMHRKELLTIIENAVK